jgi:competence protein ComGC
MRWRRSKEAFTKVEVLVISGIVILCVVLAVPNFLQAKINMNQNKTVSSLLSLQEAIATYVQDYKEFPKTLNKIPTTYFSDLDLPVAASSKSKKAYNGYKFIYYFSKEYNRYLIFAKPEEYEDTGDLSFVVNVQGVVYQKDHDEVKGLLNFDFANDKFPLWNVEDRGLILGGTKQSKEIFWKRTKIEEN